MANQMIALQARGPQLPDPSRQTAQYVNMMNMARQSEAAQRQASLAQQTMDIKQAEEARAVRLAEPQFAKAQSEADSERLDYVMDFFKTSEIALANSSNPQQATALGDRIKQMFPEPEFQQSIDETLTSIPQDPGQFETWREDRLRRTMEAKDQLEQQYKTQTTGTQQREISMPKYGRGEATEVPGSRIKVAEGMQYIKDDYDNIIAVPKTTGGGFDTPAPSTGASGGGRGGKGGVAAALQTNPGALKDGAFAKSQPGYTGASAGFATFDTAAAGTAAQENLLRTAYVNKGFNTVNKIINKYAPQGPENSAASVSNYKAYVAKQAGVDINAPITAAQVPTIAKAMREFETGNTSGSGARASTGPRVVVKGTKASNEARNAKDAAMARYDSTIATAKRLLNNPDLDSIIGNIQGNIPDAVLSLLSQNAANALADYNNLLTVAGFQELQAMRDASPSGAALGPVSDRENIMLQQSSFASSRTQDEKKFRASIQIFIDKLEASRKRVLRAYEQDFGKPTGGTKTNRPKPGTPKPKTPVNTGWGKAKQVGE